MPSPADPLAGLSADRVTPSPRTEDWRARAHGLIPGGAHTYAKGDDQYPLAGPAFLERGRGARVWDSDGRCYVEYGSGLRAVTLGHAHPPVVRAVQQAAALGGGFVRPSMAEAATAEALLAHLDRPGWMVKFAKNGSDCTTAAVRLARAATGRDQVAICHDHPFFSTDDWFIGTTPMAAGIPAAVMADVTTFPYGDVDALADVLADGDVAAVVMEAAKYDDPPPGWFDAVTDLCRRHGTVFVLDEMITGFRWPDGSALRHYGLEPDLVAYGKALGNGFAVSALVGRPELMELGGLRTRGDRVFLLSTTHGAELTGLAAARAVIDCYATEAPCEAMQRQGSRLRDDLAQLIADRGADHALTLEGPPQNMVFGTPGPDGQPSQAFRTLLLQELAAGGVIGPSLVIGAAHTDADLDLTVRAFAGALDVLQRAHDAGTTDGLLVGPPSKPVFRTRA